MKVQNEIIMPLQFDDTHDSDFQHLDDLDDEALAKLIDEDLKHEV